MVPAGRRPTASSSGLPGAGVCAELVVESGPERDVVLVHVRQAAVAACLKQGGQPPALREARVLAGCRGVERVDCHVEEYLDVGDLVAAEVGRAGDDEAGLGRGAESQGGEDQGAGSEGHLFGEGWERREGLVWEDGRARESGGN